MPSLTSTLDRGEWSASQLDRFTPQGKSPWYPLDRRLGTECTSINVLNIEKEQAYETFRKDSEGIM